MATKFAQFIQDNKIDPRRLIATSKRMERLRPTDRRTKLLKSQAKASGKPAGEEGDKKALEKPHSGRPVTPRLIQDASGGKAVSGAAKTRLLRAVNRVLEQAKKSPVDLRALF
jgi:hypothetical protein